MVSFSDGTNTGNTNQNIEGFSNCIIVGNRQITETIEVIDILVYTDKVRVYTKSSSNCRQYYISKEKEIEEKICKKKSKTKHSYKEVEKRNRFFK